VKNAYLWYVAVEGAKMAVVLGRSGSECLAVPGNTGTCRLGTLSQRHEVVRYIYTNISFFLDTVQLVTFNLIIKILIFSAKVHDLAFFYIELHALLDSPGTQSIQDFLEFFPVIIIDYCFSDLGVIRKFCYYVRRLCDTVNIIYEN
jgi:hypothetical protein